MRKFLWLCPPLMLVAAAVALMFMGFTIKTAVIISLMLVCPVIIIYGLIKVLSKPAEIPLEPFLPHTQGMRLNRIAPFYDRLCAGFGLGQPFREATLHFAKIRKGEQVLDAGCGTGTLTRLAADVVGPMGLVTGIDPSVRMISIARRDAALLGNPAEFRLAVIENLPFKNETFDLVLSSLMLHHLPPDIKKKGLTEVYRVLKPGGRLLLVDIGRPVNPLWWVFVWPLLSWSFTRDHVAGRLAAYFHQAGFVRVETAGHWMGILSFWLAYKPIR